MSMKTISSILSINGSDCCGITGVQADVRTISALGGYPLTVVSSVVVQTPEGIHTCYPLPSDVVVSQVCAAICSYHPEVVKVGIVEGYETVRLLRNEIIGCRKRIIVPGILSSRGERMVSDDTLSAIKTFLIPEATLCIVRCSEAEVLLECSIVTQEDMVLAAEKICRMGAEHVLLRGGNVVEDCITTLFFDGKEPQFFSSHNIDGWQQHGISGAISSAIATYMAMGYSLREAISHAHTYMHSQVVYRVENEEGGHRPADLYNAFMSLVVQEHAKHHDVAYYCQRLAITQQYLSRVTAKTVEKTPKEVLSEYLLHQASVMLQTSRLTVQEISQHLGFSSQASFSRFFHSATSLSPKEFRNNNAHSLQ